MRRPVISSRILVLTVAASAGAGIALGALSAYSTEASHPTSTVPAAARLAPPFTPATSGTTSTTSMTGTGAAPGGTQAPASPLTADQASAIAVQASPGTVVEVKQDNEAGDPTEATDPSEATDPTEPAETAEPAGLE